MALIRWDPFRDFLSLEDEFKRMMQRAFSGERPARAAKVESLWLPDIEMHEKEDEVVVRADLPGLSSKDIDIDVEPTGITIRGERKFAEEVKEKDYYRSERHYGAFERIVPLPTEIKPSEAKAAFKDGVLEIHLPKLEAARPKKVKVKIEEKK